MQVCRSTRDPEDARGRRAQPALLSNGPRVQSHVYQRTPRVQGHVGVVFLRGLGLDLDNTAAGQTGGYACKGLLDYLYVGINIGG